MDILGLNFIKIVEIVFNLLDSFITLNLKKIMFAFYNIRMNMHVEEEASVGAYIVYLKKCPHIHYYSIFVSLQLHLCGCKRDECPGQSLSSHGVNALSIEPTHSMYIQCGVQCALFFNWYYIYECIYSFAYMFYTSGYFLLRLYSKLVQV